jgi:DNA primase
MSELGANASSQKALLDVGMLTQNEKKRTYDRFRHRIMFPIHDHRGRIVGFGGRVLGDGEPKYLNSPETPIFHKGSELYGLFAARGGIKEADGVLVVEGYMDVVALAQAGINNAVATLGTATSSMHLQRLFRHTHNITFSFDGDRAGKAAGWKALETTLPLLEDGYQVSFLFLPDDEDPDTMIKKVGKEGFEKLVAEAMPLPEFLIETLKSKADINRLDGRAKLAKLAKPMIQQMPKSILRSLIIERVVAITQANAIDIDVAPSPSNANQTGRGRRQAQPRTATATSMTTVRRALSLILQYPQHAAEYSTLAEVTEDQVRGIKMVHELVKACTESEQVSTASLLERYRQESYFDTLMQLANHQHNNIEHLSDEEAILIIRANNAKIFDEHKASKLTQATAELAALSGKQKITELSAEELARKEVLATFVRESYK